MKKYCLAFCFMLVSFFSCDASEDDKNKALENMFLSWFDTKTSYMDAFMERLNIILMINPSCFSDEEVSVPLVKLQAMTRNSCFCVSAEHKTLLFFAYISDEKEFFGKPIKLREVFVREIYFAAKSLAETQVPVTQERFEMQLLAKSTGLCNFKNGKATYYEGFMK